MLLFRLNRHSDGTSVGRFDQPNTFRRSGPIKNRKANREVKARHADAIAKETLRLEAAIADATKAQDTEKRKSLQKELAEYQKRMADTIVGETRSLLKERFPYAIFLYEAEKVGITATGEADQNELFPNDRQSAVG